MNVTSVLWGNKIYETIRTADFLVESRCGQTFQRLAIMCLGNIQSKITRQWMNINHYLDDLQIE